MIKTFIDRLFSSQKKSNEIASHLKRNPNFRTKEELEKYESNSNRSSYATLDKGKVESISAPDLGNQNGLTLTIWYFKPGNIIKTGDIVCSIGNENITMEFESVFNGRIISTCKLNEKLIPGSEIFKIEGI